MLLITPKSEIENRIKKLQIAMQKKEIAGVLIIQKADLFYFSGTCQDAQLFVPASFSEKPFLMVKKSFERAKKESPIEDIRELKSSKELFSAIFEVVTKGEIALELDVLPAATYLKYKKFFSPLEIVDISSTIRKIRAIKSFYEIDLLKKSATILEKLFTKAPMFLKEGTREIDIAKELELICRSEGSQGFVRVRRFNLELYWGHIMSGASAAVSSFFDGATGGSGVNVSFPQGAGYNKIKKNEPILIDYTSTYEGYMVDQTRIFSIGKISNKLLRAHSVALNIKKEIIKNCKVGANGKDMYDIAVKLAEEAGLINNFMGIGKDRAMFVGHGIGIELDELPVLAKGFNIDMKAGMVLAIEPKFVFEGEGVVGVEDTFVIRDENLEQITLSDDAVKVI